MLRRLEAERGVLRRLLAERGVLRRLEPGPPGVLIMADLFTGLKLTSVEKKSAAGAAKKLAGSSTLREEHKEIVLYLLFFR